ncbi:MAG: hypothetical protein RL338_318 [Chloroflexota bacterium]|jgi:predicted Zn-dependent protease
MRYAPPPRDPAPTLELAEAAVRHALDAGADEAEAVVLASDSALTRFANSEIHQNVAERSLEVRLRFIRDGRSGVVTADATDDEGLRRLAGSAAGLTRLLEPQPDLPSLPDPTPLPEVTGAFAEATATASPAMRAEGARAVIAAADAAGVGSFGSFTTSVDWTAVVNSRGIRVAEARTRAHLVTVAMGPDEGTGYAESCAVDVGTIDAAALGREAAATARASARPVDIAPGDYPVVLAEYAVGDILDYLGYCGFSALAVQQGRSFFEAGKRIGSPLVTIWDDALDPAGTPASFDFEGVAKQRVPLVVDGVCREIVHDAATAAAAGRRSTGHGLPAPNTWGPFPLNMVMRAGDASRDELIGGLERGLLVTRIWYSNPVHQKQLIMTGMTRDGTFLVEGGRIVGPVRNLRFTHSYLDALAATSAVGRERRTISGMLGTYVVPSIRADSFTFTGATER